MHMLDLMSSIIMEGDGVTQELLDTILINLIPAHKVDGKNMYSYLFKKLSIFGEHVQYKIKRIIHFN